jgi:type IV pilus assembly protein PilC
MARYYGKIGTSEGRVVEKAFRARNRYELQQRLDEEGVRVFRLRRSFRPFTGGFGRSGRGWSSGRFLLFNQELLVLMRSGMPVLDVLDSLVPEKETAETVAVLAHVRQAVEGGSALSDAFASHPAFFPSLFIASVRAGEQTGDLSRTLSRYLDYQKRVERLRSRMRSAALYPLLLVMATLAVLLFLLFYVVPSFAQIYADARVALPWLTRLVLAVVRIGGRLLPLLAIAGAVLAWLAVKAAHTSRGRFRLDAWKIRLPLMGHLSRLTAVVHFCRTTSTILESGLPLVSALELGCGVLNNRVLQHHLGEAVDLVREGESLNLALGRGQVFPSVALRLLATGEKTGNLSRMFQEVADYYEAELEGRLERLAGLVEPAIMLVVGVLIGALVIAIYLPIFQMAGTIR